VILLLALAAAVPPAATERTAWYDCLESYAQVAMASTGTNATIAVQGQEACAAERRAYQLALFRSRAVSGDGSALIARLDAEDRAASAHVIAFIARLR
jgi:hypothetical protein